MTEAMVARYIYAWLYFGVLDEYFQRRLDFTLLRRTKADGSVVLDSTRLLQELQKYHAIMLRLSLIHI